MKISFVFRISVVAFLVMHAGFCYAQKQLVVIRKEDVKLRLFPGDEIVLKVKGSKKLRESYVNNLLDHAIVLHRDTVPLNQIERIYFRQHSIFNTIGGLLVGGGVAFLIIDQVNNSLVQGNEFSVDSEFSKSCLIAIGVGLPMVLIKKKSAKIGYKNRVMIVSKGSGFYRPDTRKTISPYGN